ncbi:phosphoglycolate phosphatase [Salipaludibacillus keqinensis]|jgi:5-amino-6-(5-phospho-D-ribitylamino)uracil phosphatase|uniref:Phosphoglycolate phosphatase n=2 Tax=Salipaludibacillus keqinensis TaxID=2045207 RepID=A0A323TMC0_9BACI|nr:Cof-type HAD-IIB family hydrolase [Salipaludibacillus keqinensis]PYZ95194.1 phosphoglycolate phosphatase [Salipaludibacillus keqinensis]
MTSPQIKLIALDMDGTLLNEHHEVSELNRSMIKEAQKQGIDVVLCTGRSLMACEDYAKELNLTSYLVTGNGSEIWHTSGELVDRSELKSELIEMMWELRNKHQTNHWAASVDKVWKNEMPEDIPNFDWLKFGFDIEDDEVRKTIFDLLSQHDELEVSNSSLTNIEINAAGVNKAVALTKLCEKLGCEMENVLAVGDSLNDMAMIKESGVGVAMGNAQQIVKDQANWVTTSHNEDGVARAIEKFCFSS